MQTNAGVDSSFNYSTANFTNAFVQKPIATSTSGDTGFDDLVWYRPDIKNTCCLGPVCITNGIRIDGVLANGGLGTMMAVSDVNGDGIPDLIMMAWDATNGWWDLYVIFGQSNRKNFPNPFPVSLINGTNGFVLTNIGGSSNINPSLTLGDVNGDGITDIILQFTGTNCLHTSTVYIVFGQTGSVAATSQNITTLTNASSPQVTTLYPGSGNDAGCFNVAVGDINGDGINDVIFASDYNGANNNKGKALIYFGHPTASAIAAGTYPNGPPTVWPTTVDISDLTGGTAKGGSYGYVQQNANNTTASSNSVSFPASTAAGNLIMVAFDYPKTATFSSIADSQGNTFTQAGSTLSSKGNKKTRVYYAKNINGGADTVTITFSASTTSDIYVTEYTGISTVTPVDIKPGATGNSSGTASASGTTTVPGDILYAFCFVDSGAGCTAGAGFTSLSTFDSNLVENVISTSSGSYAATGTAGSSWTMQMVALKPAPGLAPSYGFTILGKANNYYEGEALAVGDLNGAIGDNGGPIEDIIMTSLANQSSDGGIIFGQNSSYSWPNPVNLNGIAAGYGVNITNLGTGGYGITLATGDVTGDGIDDLIIGCWQCNNPDTGWTNIVYGSASYWTTHNTLNMNTLTAGVNQKILNTWTYNTGNQSLNIMAVDVSGDGKKDLLMASPGNSPGIKVIYNDVWGGATTWPITNITGNNGFIFVTNTGTSTFTVGDLNNDHINDIVVGAYNDSPNSMSNAGSTFVIWGVTAVIPTAEVSTRQPPIRARHGYVSTAIMPVNLPATT